MKPSYGSARTSGGWKKPSFGGRAPSHKRSFSDRGPKQHASLFSATCAECGTPCEVPFKPNGKKPVLCRDCFKKDGGAAPSLHARTPFSARPSFDRPTASDSSLSNQLETINRKLDTLLEMLSEEA